jgi:hypothetical protein
MSSRLDLIQQGRLQKLERELQEKRPSDRCCGKDAANLRQLIGKTQGISTPNYFSSHSPGPPVSGFSKPNGKPCRSVSWSPEKAEKEKGGSG